jgi:hypothetical protein
MFNVGDVVIASRGTIFAVTAVSFNGHRVSINFEGQPHGTYAADLFTLLKPAAPPTPKLTGLAQFYRDKEKQHEASI